MRNKLGRRPGNQDTRGLILAAAREAFAERGFAGASLRQIAAEVGVDPAMIHHYFDSKDQLFLATMEMPGELPRNLERVVAGGPEDLGVRMVRSILTMWESDLQPALAAGLRTALHEPALARPLREFLTLEVLSKVVRTMDVPEAEATRRAGLIASQVLGLLVGRYLLKIPGLADAGVEEVVAHVGPTVQAYLEGRTRDLAP